MTENPGWTTRFDETTSRLYLEEGGVFLGGMELILNPPHEAVLCPPRVEPGGDVAAVAAAVVAAGVRHADAAGMRSVSLYLDDRGKNYDAFVAAAPAWGFELDAEKILVRAFPDALRLDAVPAPPADADFFSEDPELAEVLGRVLATSVTASDRAADPRAMVAEFEDRCRRDDVFHREDWVVLRVEGRAAGVVFPAFVERERQAATNLYVGTSPEFRGRGLGAVLVRRGIETMLGRGATRYIGSCDVANAPMRRVFERVGCTQIATRRMYVRTTLPA